MSFIKLTSQDNHQFDTYECKPESDALGSIIVLHEIFGITPFIEEVCKKLSVKGYHTVAPALYDRYERNLVIPYSEEGYEKALISKQKALNWEQQLLDIDATKRYLLNAGASKIGIIGFSWGATLGWLAGCRLKNISCVVCYSGPHIFQFVNEVPKCAMLLHFADQDELVPLEQVMQIHEQHPAVEIYNYPAPHAFYCTGWKPRDLKEPEKAMQYYEPNLAKVADKRTEQFLHNIILKQTEF